MTKVSASITCSILSLREALEHERDFNDGKTELPLTDGELKLLADYYDAVATLTLPNLAYRVIGSDAARRSADHNQTLFWRKETT